MAIYLMVDDAVVKQIRGRPFSICSQSIDQLEKRWSLSSAKCDLAELKLLYEQDNDLINKKDYFTGYAAIHWAAKKGHSDILRWLFEQQADINLRTNGGYSALHIATMHGKENIIFRLIQNYDADINLRDYSGRKPRHYLLADSSQSIQLLDMHVDACVHSAARPMIMSPSLTSSISMPSISRKNTFENLKTESQEEPGKKKKRALSITQSFKNRKRVIIEKRGSREENPSSPGRRRKPTSVPDVSYFNQSENRKKSLTEYPHFQADSFSANIIRRKGSASEHVINGYAGFINNNKYHRKPPSTPSIDSQDGQWGINTWV